MESNSLHIPGTKHTPEILLDLEKGQLQISGKSLVNIEEDFYCDILGLLDPETEHLSEHINCTFYFENLDIYSQKMIYLILRKLQNLPVIDIHVNWKYANDDNYMKEMSEDFSRAVMIPFQISVCKN